MHVLSFDGPITLTYHRVARPKPFVTREIMEPTYILGGLSAKGLTSYQNKHKSRRGSTVKPTIRPSPTPRCTYVPIERTMVNLSPVRLDNNGLLRQNLANIHALIA